MIFLAATLASASYASAETIAVKYWGDLNLAPFTCTDITRSSFINRACYDRAKHFMVVQLRGTYYPYCEMPAATYQSFLDAPSMGKFYNANIKGSGSDGPYDCRTNMKPSY
jgi:KTSC domain-containing protein